jgi:Fumarylacetoacetate (FAA) hydrolase family/Rv2993c-like, N-terminal
MFHPLEQPLERGWVGRIDGERVIQLAAQTLQSFFTGGGTAREHAEYPLADVRLLAPVLRPPAIRVFDDAASFAFANPAAILGPAGLIPRRPPRASDTVSQGLVVAPRLAAILGAGGELAAFTILAEWRDPARAAPKDRDFALGLGPAAVTADELPDGIAPLVRVDGVERSRALVDGFDWEAAVRLAADGTELLPGELLAAPSSGDVDGIPPGSEVEIEVDGIGILAQRIAG